MTLDIVRKLSLVGLVVILVGIALALLPRATGAQSPDAAADLVRVHEHTLNNLVSATLPITVRGETPLKREVCFIWCTTVTVCEGRWFATVDTLDVAVRPEGIAVSGTAAGTWQCLSGVDFEVEIQSSMADVVYEPSDNSLHFVVPATIDPCFGPICAGRHTINITIPPVSLAMAKLSYETPAGDRFVAMYVSNVDVSTGDGYVELKGDVDVR